MAFTPRLFRSSGLFQGAQILAACSLLQVSCAGTSEPPGDRDGSVCTPGCASGQSCLEAVCQCQSGLSECASGCVDTRSSASNCGTCEEGCAAEELCSAGACITAAQGCPVETMACGGGCVDITASHLHCGKCDVACSTDQSCEAGVCIDLASGSGGSGAGGNTASGGNSSDTGGNTGTSTGGSGSASGGDAGGGSSAAGGADNGGSGSGGSDSGSSRLADQYPCDGTTTGYDVVVMGSGNNWTISGSGSSQSITTGMAAALSAGYGRLSGSSGNKGTMLVQGDGSIDASAQLKMPSNMLLNMCGTVDVTGTASGSDKSPFYARDRSYIDIPHITITGNAQYGMFFRDVSNLHLGDIHINGTGGLGIRIDSNGSNDRNNAKNITIDYALIENTGGHGIEFYGVDGIEIGTVVARSTGDCGLILNRSINANIGLVDAVSAAHIGTGYAAFRTANNNGQYDDGSYPTNIHLGELRASGSDAGRGYFCVTSSGGVEIGKFIIDGIGGDPAIFVENCHNVTMASASGSGKLIGGRAYIGNNTANGPASSDVTFQNITLSAGAKMESSSATCENGNKAVNVTGGSVDICN